MSNLYSMNKVVLLGNIGKIQEFKTQSGGFICKINLATTENVKKDGAWIDETEWHTVVVFGKYAEMCLKSLSVGSKLMIEGRLKTSSFVDKNDIKKYTTEIIAETIKFVEPKKTEPVPATNYNQNRQEYSFDNDEDDGLPF